MAALISIGQIIDKTFHLYEHHFLTYIKITAWMLLSIPILVVSMVLFPFVASDAVGILVVVLIVLLNALFAALVGYFVMGNTILATDAFDKGQKSYTLAWNPSSRRFTWRLFVQGTLLGLMVLGTMLLVAPGLGILVATTFWEDSSVVVSSIGMFLLFFGGVAAAVLIAWFSVIFPMAPLALTLTSGKIIPTIRQAFALVQGRWWATMVRVLVPKITLIVIVLFVQFLVLLFMFLLSTAFVPLSELVGETAVSVLISSIQQILTTGIAAITTPVFIIADYYVFQSLVGTRSASAA